MANRKHGVPSPKPTRPPGLGLAWDRQNNGVTLDQVADTTKIAMRYLLAIESENFAELPAGIFAPNYLRQYAEACGYDADKLIRIYDERMAGSEEAKPMPPQPQLRGFLDRLFRVSA